MPARVRDIARPRQTENATRDLRGPRRTSDVLLDTAVDFYHVPHSQCSVVPLLVDSAMGCSANFHVVCAHSPSASRRGEASEREKEWRKRMVAL